MQPWVLGKEGKTAELGTVLYTAAEALRIVSGMLYPVMPAKMSQLRRALGLPGGDPDFEVLDKWGVLQPGAAVGEMLSLFPRISSEPAEEKTDAPVAPKPGKETSATRGVAKIGFDEFGKVELKTARVLSAEKVEGTDKLLKLQIDVGGEQRQIVAGIAQSYEPEALPGRTIVVVANLQPAKIRKVESNGMLLAATSGDTLRLITVDGEIPSGSNVG
jgi:methionyl-tRNA synthetase